jgi:Protein of unknown function (DUF4089)
MATEKIDWPAYVAVMTAVHRLPLDDTRRGEVIQQLVNIEVLAQRVMEFPLEPEVEPAPVFRP